MGRKKERRAYSSLSDLIHIAQEEMEEALLRAIEAEELGDHAQAQGYLQAAARCELRLKGLGLSLNHAVTPISGISGEFHESLLRAAEAEERGESSLASDFFIQALDCEEAIGHLTTPPLRARRVVNL